jgi:hypothetical protein
VSDFRKQIETNLFGTIIVTKAALHGINRRLPDRNRSAAVALGIGHRFVMNPTLDQQQGGLNARRVRRTRDRANPEPERVGRALRIRALSRKADIAFARDSFQRIQYLQRLSVPR